jgi:peptide/nickel transport system ATP-binding protein
MTSASLLQVEDLQTAFFLGRGRVVRAVDGVSFSLAAGRALGIVGESGSGKSTIARSILRVIDPPGRIVAGRVLLDGRDLLPLPEREMRTVRGRKIALIFQDPTASLDPLFRIGDQLIETVRVHEPLAKRAARDRAIETLRQVGIPDGAAVLDRYPVEFSAGFRQRIMIAMSMICRPALLIADEPTTSLGVTVQAQVLAALAEIRRRQGQAIVFITHDFGVVSQFTDDVMVMYAGMCVEYGPKRDLLARPRHPYTIGLIRSVPLIEARRGKRLKSIPGFPPDLTNLPSGCPFAPRCDCAKDVCREVVPLLAPDATGRLVACHFPQDYDTRQDTVIDGGGAAARESDGPQGRSSVFRTDRQQRPSSSRPPAPPPDVLLDVQQLSKHYPLRQGAVGRNEGVVRVLEGVSFQVRRGETVGLVGETGAGKSVLLRCLIGVESPTTGRVLIDGHDLSTLDRRARKAARRELQLVFQDPLGSLHPRLTIGDILSEPLAVHGIGGRRERRERVAETLSLVGLDPAFATRYPHQLSGGQRQRVGVARALMLRPQLLLMDEAITSLDVSLQAQVLNLLMDLQAELGLTYLVVAHDLAVLRQICDRILVLYLGRIVEAAAVEAIYADPLHPFTRAVLAASPTIARGLGGESGSRAVTWGDVPNAADPPPGCAFHPRCPYAIDRCRVDAPTLDELVPDHDAACHVAAAQRRGQAAAAELPSARSLDVAPRRQRST